LAQHCFCCSCSSRRKNETDFDFDSGDKYEADPEGDSGSHALVLGPVRTAAGCTGGWWKGAAAVRGIQNQTHRADMVGEEQASLSLMLSQHSLDQVLSPVQAAETHYLCLQCQDC
jgi:hypothetical protein